METTQQIKSRHNTVKRARSFQIVTGSAPIGGLLREQSVKAVHNIPSGRLACQFGWKPNEFEPKKPPIMVANVNWQTQMETA